MSFPERLRKARKQRGMTQQQVADLMQFDKSTYCGYETGKRQPDLQKIKQIASILGVSGDELLETGRTAPDRRAVTDEDIKFALFGGDGEITDEMFEEVKRFAAYVKEREKKG
ncbi:MAG: helix-turn-helix transcriptional regulator [Oscillospiraceae bacterium]|nr:helix-turn-helix transcriptional regulator [Oscillospiraceae bacterium]